MKISKVKLNFNSNRNQGLINQPVTKILAAMTRFFSVWNRNATASVAVFAKFLIDWTFERAILQSHLLLHLSNSNWFLIHIFITQNKTSIPIEKKGSQNPLATMILVAHEGCVSVWGSNATEMWLHQLHLYVISKIDETTTAI